MISNQEFKEEVASIAAEISLNPREVHIRPMKSKWASCSSKGRLTFSAELLSQPEDFRRDVVVHELLHLHVPNHGKLFKALQRSYGGKGRK
jgi:predicted metal-dependent hydrolase